MKKLIIILFIVMLVCTGCGKEEKKTVFQDKVWPDEMLDDLFFDYYQEASAVMEEMSLEEKVGQLFLVRYEYWDVKDQIKDYYPGGYVLFAKDFQDHTKTTIKSELDAHQKLSKIPLTFAVDEEGGYVTRVSRFSEFRSEKFQSSQYYYNLGGYDKLKEIEEEKASLLLSLGLNMNLAPVADVSTDTNDFIHIRTFGKDANETSTFISNMVGYAKDSGISSCLKHFPGYGNNVDTHTGSAYDKRSYETFTSSDYLPFISGVKAGVPSIMVSHNVMESVDSNYPSSLSKKVITGELRDKLNFSGIVITDDLAMDAVKSYVNEGSAAVLAINAGNDMIITSDFETMYSEVLKAVKDGTIKKETVDDAVRRILAWKHAYKLM